MRRDRKLCISRCRSAMDKTRSLAASAPAPQSAQTCCLTTSWTGFPQRPFLGNEAMKPWQSPICDASGGLSAISIPGHWELGAKVFQQLVFQSAEGLKILPLAVLSQFTVRFPKLFRDHAQSKQCRLSTQSQ